MCVNQIKTMDGKILFESKNNNVSLLDTLVEAINKHVNLDNANLRGIDLEGEDLMEANLRCEDLLDMDLLNV